MNNVIRNTLLIPMIAVLAGCSQEAPPPKAAESPAEPPASTASAAVAEAAPAEETAAEAPTGELAGTSWRLVKIMSMDDSTDVPDDPALYTLNFGADGVMSLQADCNRGSGSWSSESPGQLQFGMIAATRAMCPPGPLHDTYLAQFVYVRSYVMDNGHLFLATRADGSIIEFEPAPVE